MYQKNAFPQAIFVLILRNYGLQLMMKRRFQGVGRMKRSTRNAVVVSEIIPAVKVDSVIVMLGQRPP